MANSVDKVLVIHVYYSNYKFPPPTTAVDDTLVEEIGNKEIQVSLLCNLCLLHQFSILLTCFFLIMQQNYYG